MVHRRIGRALRSIGRRITGRRKPISLRKRPRGLLGQFRQRQRQKARDLNRFR